MKTCFICLSLQPDSTSSSMCLRSLFTVLVKSRKPVVFHNALTDLVYLYQNFYASLPPTMSSFIADLTEIFEGGVYDTKYITDYVHRMPASYLEYVFRKRSDLYLWNNRKLCHIINKDFFCIIFFFNYKHEIGIFFSLIITICKK